MSQNVNWGVVALGLSLLGYGLFGWTGLFAGAGIPVLGAGGYYLYYAKVK